MTSELEDLFVEEGEQAVDSLLRSVLEGLVGFTRDGKIITKPAFLKISHQGRLLVALLARHATVRLKIEGAQLEASAESLHEQCLVPLKSAREYLSRAKAKRLVDRNSRGYFVPSWAISSVADTVKAAS